MVQDIDRPDVGTTPPKMGEVWEQAKAALDSLPLGWLRVTTNDNIMSTVEIRGTVEPKSDWQNGIFHNAHYFIIHLQPAKGARYYTPGEKITGQIVSTGPNMPKWRKYTATPEKVIAKVKAWLEAAIEG